MTALVEKLRAEAKERHTINLEGDPVRFRDAKIEDDSRWQAADELERIYKMNQTLLERNAKLSG